MNNGFITLHRKMIKWEWYTDVNTCHLFIHMLLRANHEDNNWRGQVVKRGQFISGRKQLSIETGLTESQVRTAIAKLETTGEVASKTTNKNTTYTLVNYDFYQSKNTGNRQQDSQEVANKSPRSRQQDSQQIATNNNDKQYNNENNDNNDNNYYSSIVERMESFAVQKFNEKFGTNYKKITTEFESIAHLYTEEEIMTAIDNAYLDDFWQDKATPLNIFKANNLEKLINTKPKITTANKLLAEQDIEW